MSLLRSDKAVREAVLGDQALLFAQASPDKIAELNANIRKAEGPGFQEQELRALKESPATAMIIQEMGQQERAKSGIRYENPIGELRKQEQNEFENVYLPKLTEEKGFLSRWNARLMWYGGARWYDDPAEHFQETIGGDKFDSQAAQEFREACVEMRRQILHSETALKFLESIDRKMGNPSQNGVQANRHQHAETDKPAAKAWDQE